MVAAWLLFGILGQPASTVVDDQTRLKGQLQTSQADGYQVETITAPDGTVVREYIAPDGVVFGIAWQAALIPDLAALIGPAQFAAYQTTAQASAAPIRHGPKRVQIHDLVVESTGSGPMFRGRAFLLNQIPGDLTETVVQ